jgi:hypothetical protein
VTGDAKIIQFPTPRLQHGDDIEVDQHDGEDGVFATAVFDRARAFRYVLTRQWAPGSPLVFLMLNPSTADAFILDATVRRCIGFAKREGYGAALVLNIFALRSRNPRRLREVEDPVGPLNDDYIMRMTHGRTTVCAWGTHGAYLDRGKKVARMLAAENRRLVCLHQTKEGHPGHPLYLSQDSPLRPFEVR